MLRAVVERDEADGFPLVPSHGRNVARQLISAGDKALKYIGNSKAHDPDIAENPDRGKFAAMGIFPGPSLFQSHLMHVGRLEDGRAYWEGEDT